MRADRLLKMTLLLQKNKQMRAEDLAEQLEVSLSTIYRDIDALGIAGIPVYTQPGTNGGIFIEEGFRASLTDLSQEQILSLFLAINAKSLAAIGMQDTSEVALLKVFNTLPTSQQAEVKRLQQRFYIDPESWFNSGDTPQHLEILQQAVWEDQRLEIVYQSYTGSPYDVTIDAYGLVSKSFNWYLVGRKESGEYRTYRLTRIREVQASDVTFERDSDFDLADYWQTSHSNFQQQMEDEFPVYPVEVSVHADALWYLTRILEGQFQKLNSSVEDGWHRAVLQLNSEVEAKAHILAMGTNVKVISPPHLSEKIKQMVYSMSKHYEG